MPAHPTDLKMEASIVPCRIFTVQFEGSYPTFPRLRFNCSGVSV